MGAIEILFVLLNSYIYGEVLIKMQRSENVIQFNNQISSKFMQLQDLFCQTGSHIVMRLLYIITVIYIHMESTSVLAAAYIT